MPPSSIAESPGATNAPYAPHDSVIDNSTACGNDISFEDNCVIVDSETETEQAIYDRILYQAVSHRRRDKSITVKDESGTQKSGSDPISGTDRIVTAVEKPQLRRRLSLSSLVNINLPSSPIKLSAFTRRLPNSSPSPRNCKPNKSKSSPASPILTSPVNPSTPNTSKDSSNPTQSFTMPAVPPMRISTIPSPPTCADRYPAIKHFWTDNLPSPDEEEESFNVDIKETLNSSNTPLGSSVSWSIPTTLDEDAVSSPPAYMKNQLSAPIAPILNHRRTPLISRNSSFADDLTSLIEVDESHHYDYTPPSPSSKSCSGIWLCSPPAVSKPDKSLTTPLFTSRPINKTKNRPVVIRSLSTGKLASEFDEDGRVVCLSGHSDRILKTSVSPPRSYGLTPKPNSLASQSTPHLGRSKSYQVTRSKPIESPSLTTLPSLPAKYATQEETSRERLIENPTLSRALSMGSWRKKAWSVGRSVRV
ncbi:uncharacterized protein I206_100547 [Kwoniella pini CBS 10737]|uniref:Uncharacterized protein n=1 Tax=Kwoniella pini CBS 10737 TaxID=1296096 RepID=A0A1B9ICV2_9TREE|nr:uncharacterized protein I206_00778 [Kwoniella pini CBS 10737]OCF53475.1 hypothetical protein I206_00778 [Kwoniella pini CBS 10737]